METPDQVLQRASDRLKKEKEQRDEDVRLMMEAARERHRRQYSGWGWSTNGTGVSGCMAYDVVDTLVHVSGERQKVDPLLWVSMSIEERVDFCAALTRHIEANNEAAFCGFNKTVPPTL